MSPRAVVLLCVLLVACDEQRPTPTPEPAPAIGADAKADQAPQAPAQASADAAPDSGAQPDEQSAPTPEVAPYKEPADAVALPFEDPPMPAGILWFNAYPGYASTSKIKVRAVQEDGPKTFSLYATTDVASKQVGSVTYEHGEIVSWRTSRLIIDEPRMFVATRDMTVSGLFSAKPEGPSHDVAHQDVKLKKGDKWLLYLFGEKAQCYVGLPREPMLYGPCPEAPLFTNPSKPENYIMAPLEPERATWWLLIQRKDQVGWMQVDRRVFMSDPKY